MFGTCHPDRRQLGRLPSRHDRRTIQLANHYDATRADYPAARDWSTPVNTWGIQGNDQYGNCVIVTAAHALQTWRANELQRPEPISDNAVIQISRELGALHGFSILERNQIWQKKSLFGERLWLYAQINPHNQDLLKATINTFGCADLGIALALAWRSQEIWDTGRGRLYRPGSWGLHSVPIVAYDENTVTAVTWGNLQKISWKAVAEYCDECYALISPAWIAADAISPSGFDLPGLKQVLALVTQEP